MTETITWGPKALPVPYAAAWTGESTRVAVALAVRPGGNGLGYRDEVPGDRDRHGVLWTRMDAEPGAGRPDFRALHPARQRRTMLERLCQVCGGPADRTSRGWLFLVQRAEVADFGDVEGLLSTKPPVCRPCAALAVRHCPHLTDPLLIRSRKPRTWGVFGGFFTPDPDSDGIVPHPEDHHLPYGHPDARWFLAAQLVIELTRCTVES
ncbi:hypothetical protein [Streptomyces radicis]|uniref:hypothetical protein n=1 Tax=Streptomyces radicis TaxID=1750517 RepID=UPI001E4052AE|nr:hypothetical protein [Streptomyces radicis]